MATRSAQRLKRIRELERAVEALQNQLLDHASGWVGTPTVTNEQPAFDPALERA